jgi:hypothetical protein
MIGKLAALALAIGPALCLPGVASAQATGLPALIKSLLLGPRETLAGWEELDKIRGVRWGQGPVMLDKPAPDGSTFARPGQAMLDGRPVMLAASGARAGSFSIYLRDAAARPREIEAIAQDFRAQGFTAVPARCPLAAGASPLRGWLKIGAPGRNPAFLYAGPLASGAQGYTLFYDSLPPMSQADAARYTESCKGGVAAPAGARPPTGQAVAVAILQAWLRPVGAPTSLPWAALPTAPGLTWNRTPPMRMASPYSDGGADANPRLLEGQVKSATSEMRAMATGDDRGANHLSLMDAQHMPPGAVFGGLQQAGFSITALRCGKPYTQMSDAFYRIAGPGVQPAILYRAQYRDPGLERETYILRLDNLMPPATPGQSNPVGGRCPG